jgi:hypothetical protein
LVGSSSGLGWSESEWDDIDTSRLPGQVAK